MSMLDAVLAALARTPDEQAEFWLRRHHEEYEKWFELESIVTGLQGLTGHDDSEAAEIGELVATAQAVQHQIHTEQAERGAIRDRLCDESL